MNARHTKPVAVRRVMTPGPLTRERALRYLLLEWMLCAAIVSAVAMLQSIMGKYGDDFGSAWSWLAANFIAPLSILLTASLSDPSAQWRNGPANRFRFWLAFGMSGICVGAILIVLFIEPLVSASYFEIFSTSDLPLTIWQGFALAAIGAVIFDGR